MEPKKSFSQQVMESPVWKPVGIILAIMTGLAVIIYTFHHILIDPGVAPGSDVTSFAHTAKYIVDYFLANHRFPSIDPSWYAGFELFHAPPMINYFLGIIYYFTHDINLTTRIFHPLGLAILFMGMFWLMKKEKYSTLNALLAGMIFIFIPTVLLSLWSYTKLVSLFFWPFGLYFTNKILTTSKIQYIAYLAITIGLIVYSHPMMAGAFGLMMIFYSILYAILDRKIVTRRFFLVILAVGLGFLIGAKYLIPFIFEKAGNLGTTPGESLFQLNGGLRGFYTGFGGYLVLFLPLIPLYVIWRNRQPKLIALYLSGLLVPLILVGYYFFKLGSYFPFSEVYYYIWIFYFAFVSAYFLGLVINGNSVKSLASYLTKVTLAIILFLLVVYLANHPTNYLTYFKSNENPEWFAVDNKLAQTIDQIPNPGRIFISHFPFGFTDWFLSLGTDKSNIEGAYYGIAPINRQIAHIGDAIHYQYPDYVFNKLKHFNARYFIANNVLASMSLSNGDLVGQKFMETIPHNGYQLILDTKGIANTKGMVEKDQHLYYLDKPSTYVMPVEEKVLIIGKYNSTLATAISPQITALEGGSDYLDDYDQEFLSHFDTVALYGFTYHNKTLAEKIARDYVKGGGNLVVEMFNMGISPLAEGPNFLGVSGLSHKVTAPFDLGSLKKSDNPALKDLPKTFALPGEVYDVGDIVLPYVPMTDWNSLEYAGLDQSLIKAPNDSDDFSILGYKNVEGGKVTFVGMNFFYHLFLNHDKTELSFVASLLQNTQVPPTIGSSSTDSFEAEEQTLTADTMKFQIHSSRKRLLLVSMSYSPHWKAYLNGQEIKIREMEDLMVVEVPAGNYTLEMKYGSTPTMVYAWLITIMTGLFLLFLILSSMFRSKTKHLFSKGS